MRALDHRVVVLVLLLDARRLERAASHASSRSSRPSRTAARSSSRERAGRLDRAFTGGYMERIEKLYRDIPGDAALLRDGGQSHADTGFSVLNLKPWSEREKRSSRWRASWPEAAGAAGRARLSRSTRPRSAARAAQPLQFVLMTQAPYPELQRMVERLMEEARKNPAS
jgi:hypothetical protein